MEATIYNIQRDLPISAKSVEMAISFLFAHLKIQSDEVIVHFITKKKIGKIHHDFFNDPSPTDCISFPVDSPKAKRTGPTILGEIFICPKVAIEFGKQHEIDCYEETSRYLVHGLLHLIGYDDISEEDRRKMKAKENQCMKLLSKQKLLITA